jgi:hypothetical protein
MPTITFPEITHTEHRRISCSGRCGKKLNRQRTFTQTVNPFNKNAAGEQKTSGEIYRDLRAEGAGWAPTAMCPKCTERIEGPKPVAPREIVVRTPTMDHWGLSRFVVVRAETVTEAREKAAEHIRADIATLQARLDAIDEWTYGCYPSKKCKHRDGPCFSESVEASAEAVAGR